MRKSILAAAAAAFWIVGGDVALAGPVQGRALKQQQSVERAQKRAQQPDVVRRGAQLRWQKLDKDGDGFISRNEWDRKPKAFDRLDSNKDGVLTLEEAKQSARQRGKARQQNRLKQLDKDGNGAISREEWPRQPKAFDRLDTNKDGVLTEAELSPLIRRR
jgi:Ca2+-binding EF-hand superfamily protein